MSEETKIEWTDHTGGPHFGCAPVSPGCVNCYAWALAESRLEPLFRRAYKAAGFKDWDTRPVWGHGATRVLSKGFWNDARRINAKHAKAGTRGRWFPSMVDWLDDMPGGIVSLEGEKLDPVAVLTDFLELVRGTLNLDWLLLTKRPENFRSRLLAVMNTTSRTHLAGWVHDWLGHEGFTPHGKPPANVRVGASVEDQLRVTRVADLVKIPAVGRFLSLEPLLGPVELPKHIGRVDGPGLISHGDLRDWIDWLIVGGESGPGARQCDVDWIRDLVRQGRDAGVKVFVKQLGAKPEGGKWPEAAREFSNFGRCDWSNITHPKGGDPAEWPVDLRVREWPEGLS